MLSGDFKSALTVLRRKPGSFPWSFFLLPACSPTDRREAPEFGICSPFDVDVPSRDPLHLSLRSDGSMGHNGESEPVNFSAGVASHFCMRHLAILNTATVTNGFQASGTFGTFKVSSLTNSLVRRGCTGNVVTRNGTDDLSVVRYCFRSPLVAWIAMFAAIIFHRDQMYCSAIFKTVKFAQW